MKFYRAGRKIRTIEELEEGKVYAICGVVGELEQVPPCNPYCLYKFKSQDENIGLSIGRTELMDRIHLGFVYQIKKSIIPREKTIAKLLIK